MRVRHRHARGRLVVSTSLMTLASILLAPPAVGQLSDSDLAALRERGKREGWTFTVGKSSATERSLDELCGVVIPDNWREGARFDPCTPTRDLPAYFDWREQGACTPIRNQGGCGSCWAFALLGSFESNILIKDGLPVDLSEQWLVSCCGLGGCQGEWPGNAANYCLCNGYWRDECNDNGAVLEEDFPYVASNAPCGCPYPHPYCLNTWAFVGPEWGIPSVGALKQAIVDHGPITVCVYTNSAFHGYSGGIFNACENEPITHAVVLVGWDDNQGSNGIWFLRNSWDDDWGEDGYMRIEYGCSRIGYNALYVDYTSIDCNNNGIADTCDTDCGTANGFCDVPGCGTSADCNSNWIPDECEGDCNGNGIPDDCDVASGFSEDCNRNVIPDECDISSGRSDDCQPNGIPDECDLYPPDVIPAHDDCFDAELACTYSPYYGTTSGATNDGSCSCGSSSTSPDVWYYYQPYGSGYLSISLCGSSYDTVLSLHTGCPGTAENELVCNDDYCGAQSQLSDVLVSHLSEYWIRIAGKNGSTGDYRIILIGPDCEYHGGDCNENDVPDECDIAGGTSQDANGNGIPDECEAGTPGDLNCDGEINTFDIDPFVLALTDPAEYANQYPACNRLLADIDDNGEVNTFDIDPFVDLLTG